MGGSRTTILSAAGLATVAFACGKATGSGFAGDDGGSGVDATGDDVVAADAPPTYDSAPPIHLPEAGAAEASAPGCSNDATSYVFVLSQANALYRFAPDKKTMTPVGTLGCTAAAGPNSMAVDRNAVAWVNYLDGTVHAVSTTDAGCLPQTFNAPRVGMGFSSDAKGSTAETLFLAGAPGDSFSGLASVDFGTGSIVPVGPYSAPLTGIEAELTGTGDGRLFGFFASSPVQLAEIDKASGAIVSSTNFSQIGTPSDFAFSFWGGRFYFYTYPNPTGTTSNVTEYDPTTGSTNTAYMTDVGFVIVGAGVSTCAPVTPPTPH